jgi:hypothetical protein
MSTSASDVSNRLDGLWTRCMLSGLITAILAVISLVILAGRFADPIDPGKLHSDGRATVAALAVSLTVATVGLAGAAIVVHALSVQRGEPIA